MSRSFSVSKYEPIGRAPSWKVEGRAPDGRKLRRFFKTKVEAEAFAGDANAEVRSVGWQAMGLSDEARVEAAKCLEMLASKGRTLTDAVKFYLKHLAETERSVTVDEAVAELMEFKEGKGLSGRHATNLRYFFKPLTEKFGDRKVSTLSRREMESWLNSRKIHPVSYKSTLRHLSVLFNHCVKMGTAAANPLKDIQPPKIAAEEVGILTPVAMRELLAITRKAHPDMLAALLIQGFAGLRRSEVRKLSWDAVKLADGQIIISAKIAKTRNRRSIAIAGNLAAWLASIRQESGPVAPKCYDESFAEIRRTLVAGNHKFPKNALRHSFVSYRLMKDDNEDTTAREAGHTVEELHRDYKGLVSSRDAVAWWSIMPSDATGGNVVPISAPAASQVGSRGRARKG